ncbi:MAG: hypothetical protein H7330_04615 [Hymenobacteraceae bacterium]|nr:hypothetical protein [Hymenobacteraceae bacterium]
MRVSLLLSSAAFAGMLLLTGGQAYAQVDSTDQAKPELNALPPDRPVLDPTPLPPAGGTVRPTGEAQPTPAPAAPGGVFQPARPAQPMAVPAPARRPTPAELGTPVTPEVVRPAREKSKWFVAGNPDLGFRGSNGASSFSIGLAALLGYRLTDHFAIGPGLTYQYIAIKGPGFSESFSNVGARVFGQALVTDNIFVHAEMEALRTPAVDRAGYLDLARRITVNSTFAGLGYRQHMGQRAAFDIVILYNFNYADNYFIYNQPEFRFNFLFDLF